MNLKLARQFYLDILRQAKIMLVEVRRKKKTEACLLV